MSRVAGFGDGVEVRYACFYVGREQTNRRFGVEHWLGCAVRQAGDETGAARPCLQDICWPGFCCLEPWWREACCQEAKWASSVVRNSVLPEAASPGFNCCPSSPTGRRSQAVCPA